MSERSFIETLSSAIKNIVSSEINDIEICVPATIDKCNNNGTISAKLSIGKRMVNNQELDLPIIENIRLIFSGNDTTSIEFKVDVGDDVLLHFSAGDISSWVYRRKSGIPESIRKFNINDCYAVPVKTSVGSSNLSSDENLSIISGNSSIVAKTSGSVVINGHLEVTS